MKALGRIFWRLQEGGFLPVVRIVLDVLGERLYKKIASQQLALQNSIRSILQGPGSARGRGD